MGTNYAAQHFSNCCWLCANRYGNNCQQDLQYFRVYTVRMERLKEIYNFIKSLAPTISGPAISRQQRYKHTAYLSHVSVGGFFIIIGSPWNWT